jgi:uncharacterized membrane protein
MIALGFLVVVMPIALLAAILVLVERRQRSHWDVIARQIALTDSIHREFGAIVAPTVERKRRGRWQIVMAVPFGRSEILPVLLTLAQQVVPPSAQQSPGRFRVVFTPQEPVPVVARHAKAA